jgi:hypothetical protein
MRVMIAPLIKSKQNKITQLVFSMQTFIIIATYNQLNQ